jgi:hypothetical protein
MGKIEVRRARREDIGAIEEIFSSSMSACDVGRVRAYYEERFGSDEAEGEGGVLVGISEGRVIGVVAADRFETNDVFWLSWLRALGDELRCEKLLARIIKEVRRRGGRKLYTDASTHAPHEDAERRYEALGFKAEARLKDFFGEGADKIIYGLDLTRRR